MRVKVFYILVLQIFSVYINAQSVKTEQLDSLYSSYLQETIDSNKVNTLNELYNSYQDLNPAKGLAFTREALEIAQRSHYEKGIINSCFNMGEYYHTQLKYAEAIKYYLLAAQTAEKQKSFINLSRAYNSIGIIYSNQSQNEKALQYFKKVAQISEENNLKKRLAIAYNNLGIAYKDLGLYSEAMNYYEKALKEFEKDQFERGIASASNNIGIVSHLKGEDAKALEYYQKSLDNFRKIKDTAAEAGIYTNIGELYNDNKEYNKALEFYLKGLNYSQRFKINNFRGDAYEGLAKVYANLNQYDKAYYYLQRHIKLQDTVKDEEGMQKIHEMEKRMENEKQEQEIEYLKQLGEFQKLKIRAKTEELNKNKLLLYSIAIILSIVLLMSFFIFKANKEVKRKNLELAEKKKEIQDSINYAKNIQEAMLPQVGMLQNHFPEGFGLFLPKDVVSGDFYWFNELNGMVYFAAADCTGHGVPGAFMSMIAIDKLNQSLVDKQIENPAALLANLNKSIKKALKQNDGISVSKDGLDIALCSFNRKRMELVYSGANRPLWIIRGKELIEYKATKASIAGFTEEAQEFQNHIVLLMPNDSIYIFSDGFADQFGGSDKKKYMTKRLKEKLLSINRYPMQEQEVLLQNEFMNWKGNLEQTDDVMILGFKI